MSVKAAISGAILMWVASHFFDAGDKNDKKLDKKGFGGGGSGAR